MSTNTAKLLFVTGLVLLPARVYSDDPKQTQREELYRKYLEFPSYVKGGQVEPHWMADGNSFWYAEGAPENTVVWKVDPEANTKKQLFDVAKLRDVLTNHLGHEPQNKGLPFDTFTFADRQQRSIRFAVEGQSFELHLPSYNIKSVDAETKTTTTARSIERGVYPDLYEKLSPDGKWFVGLKNHNLYLRSPDSDNLVWLTTDGVKNYEWGTLPWEFGATWSPDGRKFVVERVDYRQTPKVPVVDYLSKKTQVEWAEVEWRDSESAGETEIYIFDVGTKKRVKVVTENESFDEAGFVGWSANGTEFFYLQGYYARNIRFAATNPENGAVREILREEYGAPVATPLVTLLADGRHFIWHWDRDGWKHLYLYDLSGRLIRPLTQGTFPVERVVTVDEQDGWVYFTARPDRRRPYDFHLCRVGLNGVGFHQLTEAPGQHNDVEFSPSKKYFLDSHSSVTRPPSVDLRSVDGRLLQRLAKANTDELKDINWSPPEEFVVKGADPKTDMYGLLYKPHDFDPTHKYPVIEKIVGYGGGVPRSFLGRRFKLNGPSVCQAMAQLGFIVYIVDGRGPWGYGRRGREFEEVTWGTFGRHEIPDHVTALRNLAETRPYMDLGRVGVMGGSIGGYFAVRAMLQAPENYHVGVAVAPVIDVATHANFVWLGPPNENKEEYEFSSNLRLANELKGKLLLIQGTADLAVPIAHTMKMADAFIRANKSFDMLIIPEWGHWGNERMERYWTDRRTEYFVEHLKP